MGLFFSSLVITQMHSLGGSMGAGRQGVGLELLRATRRYLGGGCIIARGIYARTYRNETIDMLTRARPAEIEGWARGEDFRWIEPGRSWGEFVRKSAMSADRNVEEEHPSGENRPWRNMGRLRSGAHRLLPCLVGKYWKGPFIGLLIRAAPHQPVCWKRIANLNTSPMEFSFWVCGGGGGGGRSEFAIPDFQREVSKLAPMVAILIAPMGVSAPTDMIRGVDNKYEIDWVEGGDVLMGFWGVWVIGTCDLSHISKGAQRSRRLAAIGSRALRRGYLRNDGYANDL